MRPGMPALPWGSRLPQRAKVASARNVVLDLAEWQGLLSPARPGGRWSEKLVTLTMPHLSTDEDDASDERAIKWRIRVILAAWRGFARSMNKRLAREGKGALRLGDRRCNAVWFRALEWTPARDRLGHPHMHLWFFGPYPRRRGSSRRPRTGETRKPDAAASPRPRPSCAGARALRRSGPAASRARSEAPDGQCAAPRPRVRERVRACRLARPCAWRHGGIRPYRARPRSPGQRSHSTPALRRSVDAVVLMRFPFPRGGRTPAIPRDRATSKLPAPARRAPCGWCATCRRADVQTSKSSRPRRGRLVVSVHTLASLKPSGWSVSSRRSRP
jgi:hypothetical protein